MWFGFGVLALGTLIALLPETAFAFAAARVPDAVQAATASMLLLALVDARASCRRRTAVVAVVEVSRTQFERELEQNSICMCGSSGACIARSRIARCVRPVTGTPRRRARDRDRSLDRARTTKQILAAFVEKYGSQDPRRAAR